MKCATIAGVCEEDDENEGVSKWEAVEIQIQRHDLEVKIGATVILEVFTLRQLVNPYDQASNGT